MDFNRYCEVIIGPLADWQGGGNRNQAIRILADGTMRNLRVAFSAQKGITGSPNTLNMEIYGLSLATMQSIRGNLSRIQVIAGYETAPDSASIVAAGAILSAIPEKRGPDTVMTITALDGYGGMVRGAYSRAFDGNTPISSVVADMASSMPGVTVGQIDVDGQLFRKGQQFAGTTTSQLNRMADQYGFSWSVQDGIFQALSDRRDSGRVFSFSSERNLLSAVPVLNGPTAENIGVEIVAKFDARMKPGDRMLVESRVNPALNGAYKVTSVGLSFDTHGNASIKAQSLRLT